MTRCAAPVATGLLLIATAAGCASSHPEATQQLARHAAATPTAERGSSTPTAAPTVTAPIVAAPATDVTFVSATHGWALTSSLLYETADDGRRWVRLQPPPAQVTHVRFIDSSVGYAWGPNGRLWLTTDDAHTWRRGGLEEVVSLEGGTGGVWAIAGSQPYANVWWSSPGSTTWTKLGLTPNRGGTLIPHGNVTYVLGEQGAGPVASSFDVYVGDRLTADHHTLPCEHPPSYVPESPMTVSTGGLLFLVCDVQSSDGAASRLAYTSADRGRTWTAVAPPPKTAGGVAAVSGVLFAWDRDLWAYRDGHWRTSLRGPSEPADSDLAGFNLVGFEDDTHGVALTKTGELYLTSDAGRSWRASTLPSRIPAATCRATTLRVQGGRQGGGFGTAHVDIEITNTGTDACALPSPTDLAFVDSTGTRLPIETTSLDQAAGAGAVALRAGSHASLAMSWQNWCGSRTGPLDVAVTFGRGGTVTGAFDGPPDYDYWPSCVEHSKRSIVDVVGAYTVT